MLVTYIRVLHCSKGGNRLSLEVDVGRRAVAPFVGGSAYESFAYSRAGAVESLEEDGDVASEEVRCGCK